MTAKIWCHRPRLPGTGDLLLILGISDCDYDGIYLQSQGDQLSLIYDPRQDQISWGGWVCQPIIKPQDCQHLMRNYSYQDLDLLMQTLELFALPQSDLAKKYWRTGSYWRIEL